MFALRVMPHSVYGLKWNGEYPSVGRAVEIAEKENGAPLDFKFREVNHSYKAHGKRATYFIEEI